VTGTATSSQYTNSFSTGAGTSTRGIRVGRSWHYRFEQPAAFVAVTAEQDWTRNRDRELEAQTGGDAVSRANR
jgi:hypothetical protein